MKLRILRGLREIVLAIDVLQFATAVSGETTAPFDYFENSWSLIGIKDYPNGTRLTPQNAATPTARMRHSSPAQLAPSPQTGA